MEELKEYAADLLDAPLSTFVFARALGFPLEKNVFCSAYAYSNPDFAIPCLVELALIEEFFGNGVELPSISRKHLIASVRYWVTSFVESLYGVFEEDQRELIRIATEAIFEEISEFVTLEAYKGTPPSHRLEKISISTFRKMPEFLTKISQGIEKLSEARVVDLIDENINWGLSLSKLLMWIYSEEYFLFSLIHDVIASPSESFCLDFLILLNARDAGLEDLSFEAASAVFA